MVSSFQKTGAAAKDKNLAGKSPMAEYFSSSLPYDYPSRYNSINNMSSSSISEDSFADAASEKDLVGIFSGVFLWMLLRIFILFFAHY